jgi:hypothetical protein
MAIYNFRATDTADATLAAAGIAQDATTQRRVRVLDWWFRYTSLPVSDANVEVAIDRGTTALGTSTPVTPNPIDPGDTVASTVDPQENYTVNPTIGVRIYSKGGNIRQDVGLQFKTGYEPILAATANLSLLWRPIISSANACSLGITFREE